MLVTAIEYHTQPASSVMKSEDFFVDAHWVLTDGTTQQISDSGSLVSDHDTLFQVIANHAKWSIGAKIVASDYEWTNTVRKVLVAPFKGHFGSLEKQEAHLRLSWSSGPQEVGSFDIISAHVESVKWIDVPTVATPDLLGLAIDICSW